ncbi:hypothetical protein BDN72DRAFT_839569 [Pluteus cervinus]|uniref:Uncharacterized protein n=1 Tax=Pluteus cervinus TaxID=181527 RepID=A0ACD3AWI8_9AGAR|nr:hypothetical protein BDN72DRAFT_839569 [Pluteus cervinus]
MDTRLDLAAKQADPQMKFDTSALPIAHLESLKFKANQIIESIQTLQRTIEVGYQPVMPPWPDILSKYNVLLSQTHSFSSSLTSTMPTAVAAALTSGGAGTSSGTGDKKQAGNLYEKIALHPTAGMPDAQLDSEVAPLLRNQQTTDVLRMENETVRRLSEHMTTRGSLGVLGMVQLPPNHLGLVQKKPEYEDVLVECGRIRDEHDRRVDRAVKAVAMLRDKYEWKQRVEVAVEEPEELDWDPRTAGDGGPQVLGDGERDGDVDMDEEEGSSSDEDEVEGELNAHTPMSLSGGADVFMGS